jgi:hypothetical protein
MFSKMMLRIYVSVLLLYHGFTTTAQKFTADKTFTAFYSHAVIEDIKAENQKGSALFDSGSGNIAFIIPIKEFQFAKSLMNEHFNEKYMESERYPKSTFQGKISDFDPALNTEQQVTAKGKLVIHGVTQNISIPGKISKQGNSLLMTSTFTVKLADYKIEIPKLMWQNIAEEVEVTLNFSFNPQSTNP